MVSFSRTAQRAAAQLPRPPFHATTLQRVRGSRHITHLCDETFFKITDENWWWIKRSWELHRPPSTVCSGTGRPFFRVWRPGDCTDHRALYARGLVAQSASLKIWGLPRPPSTVCSGTGRPVCQFETLGTAPTTEHYTLGDWLISLSDGK